MDTKTLKFTKKIIHRYNKHRVAETGAQMAYYLILSLFPFLIFFLNLLQFTPLADVQVLDSMLRLLPVETQKILYALITEIVSASTPALLSFGALASIWSASNGTLSVIKAVNRAYDLEEDRPYWKIRGVSILFTLGLIVILGASFGIIVFGQTIVTSVLKSYTVKFMVFWNIIKLFVPLIFMVLIFSLLYAWSPSIKDGVRVKVKDTIAGSLFTSIGIIVASVIFSNYVNNFGNYTKTYGSIGGIIILLVWMYITSIIIVIGAEVNATILSMKNKR